MFLKLCKLYLHVHFTWLEWDFLIYSLVLYIQVNIVFFKLVAYTYFKGSLVYFCFVLFWILKNPFSELLLGLGGYTLLTVLNWWQMSSLELDWLEGESYLELGVSNKVGQQLSLRKCVWSESISTLKRPLLSHSRFVCVTQSQMLQNIDTLWWIKIQVIFTREFHHPQFLWSCECLIFITSYCCFFSGCMLSL